jgi:predicted  nucleic acid-binding Zn-ribbon protein
MALPEWTQNTGAGAVAALAFRWIWQEVRSRRKDIQVDQSESTAIRNLKSEITRLADRVGSLEKKLDERDVEVEDERKLRRIAENELDQERRRSAALEDRIAELESDCGND